MGLLVDGIWHTEWYDTKKDGKFKRPDAVFRNSLGSSAFPIEKNRYHLFVSLACPWAHRTIIYRKIKELENIISMSIVDPFMGEQGWYFGGKKEPLTQSTHLKDIYVIASPKYTGRVTVPILWDKKTNQIVNNESSEIIRQFNSVFDEITGNKVDLYPLSLQNKIDDINHFTYHNINNGVYKAGFATQQEAYDDAVEKLFQALDKVEQILSQSKYLVGDQITEADWRLFTTLIRFDLVYYSHFKCNIKMISEYDHIAQYMKNLYYQPGVADTVNFDHIKRHYYQSQVTINPTGIVPKGPSIKLQAAI